VSSILSPFAILASLIGFDGTSPDPHRAYQATKSEPVKYEIDFRLIVTAPQNTKKLRVWIPIPQDDFAQKVSQSKWSVFPQDIQPTLHTEKVFGNRFAYFEFIDPQGAQIITHRFHATVWQLDWDLDLSKIDRVKDWPDSFAPYRRGERAIVIDDAIRKLASELTKGKNNPGEELNAIMDWAQQNLTYDHSNTSLIADSTHALTKKRGDCSDYHGLCSSLGRALHVPTRITYGLHLFPKNLPCHCKLEAYLQPYGWVSFDVSETQRLVKRIESTNELKEEEKKPLITSAMNRFRRGFRDNTWLFVTKGTDYDLAPPANSGKVPLIATIFAEADGKALPLPDSADPKKNEFSWMTAHQYKSDREVLYPFRDWQLLAKNRKEKK
jgi:transglutaminase-like putative cysteine protease